MIEIKQQYIVDERGNRIAVVLDIEEYQQILYALEELESIKAYDEAKASNEELISFEQAIRSIEKEQQ